MIELKADGCREDLARRTTALIRKQEMEGQCVLGSSSVELLREIRGLAPELSTAYIGEQFPTGDEACADGYSLDVRFLTREAVERAHAEGKTVCAWTIDTEEELQKALELGADGLVTDDPARARALLRAGEGAAG